MMEEGGQRRDAEEVPLNTYSDSSADQIVQVASDSSADQRVERELSEDTNPEAIGDFIPPESPYGNKYTVKCAIEASVASLLLGFAIGVMSEAVVHIDKDTRMTERQIEIQAATLHVVSLFGSVIAGRISDWIGRRYTIMLAGVFLFVGNLLMGFSPNNALLLFGRAVTQVGVSFAPMIATVYIAEVSPAYSRGFLTSFPQVSINFGTVLGYAFNYSTSKVHQNFGRLVMVSMGVIWPALLAVGICVMSESPRWLIMQGRVVDAKRILTDISDSEEEAAIRLASIAEAVGVLIEGDNNVQVNTESTGEGVWRDLLLHPTPLVYHMLACTIGIHLFQQGCGIDTIVLYSPRIFEKASITSSNAKLTLTLVIHIVKAVASLLPTFCLDKVGRQRLLLKSMNGMIFGLVPLGISLTVLDHSDTKPGWAVGMCIVSLLICVGFYSIGMGSIATVYSSEIFPSRLRAQGNAISVSLSGVLAIMFLFLYKAITFGGAAFLFVAITLLGRKFVLRIMPETRGWTLEEMWKIFGNLNLWRFRVEEIEGQTNSDATAQGADIEARP